MTRKILCELDPLEGAITYRAFIERYNLKFTLKSK